MLPFGVTIPATVPQRSEFPEGLTNFSVILTGLTVCFQRQNSAEMKKTYTSPQGQTYSHMLHLMFSGLSLFSLFIYVEDLKINHIMSLPTIHKINSVLFSFNLHLFMISKSLLRSIARQNG